MFIRRRDKYIRKFGVMTLKKSSLISTIVSFVLATGLLSSCGATTTYSSMPQIFAGNASMTMSAVNIDPKGISKVTSQDGLQTLYIQPEAGAAPIINAVKKAKTSIDIQVYMITMNDLIQELINAAKRGVKVRLILEKAPFNPANPGSPLTTNIDKVKIFEEAGVLDKGIWVKWSNKAFFTYTHQKSIIIDGTTGYVLSLNLSQSAVTSNREYMVADSTPATVNEMKKIFESDWVDKQYQVVGPTNLVVSPVNSRNQLEGLINGATQTLYIGFEVIGDKNIVSLISQKTKKSLDLKVMFGHYKKVASNLKAANILKAAGITNLKFLGNPFLHGKIIISDNSAYIGSINLTNNSMEKNRELGIIVKDVKIVNALKQSFVKDYEKNADPMPDVAVDSNAVEPPVKD